MPIPTVKIQDIGASVQSVLRALGVRARYYRAGFRLRDSDALEDNTHQDFGKLESHFLRRVQSFLDTLKRP
jgi:hypothetical protein